MSKGPTVTWPYIEKNIASLKSVPGGYSSVIKGLLELPGGTQVFIKKGIDPTTNMWTKKEVSMYRFLDRHSYPYIPKLLAVNDDETGFALEAIIPSNGWVWDDGWSEDRLDDTFSAMDDLASISLSSEETAILKTKTLSESDDGWAKLLGSSELQAALNKKLVAASRQDLIDSIDVAAMSKQSARYIFKNNTLVHNDIRADNCAWNAAQRKVCLIDWNWAQIGDTKIDSGAFLVNVHKSGFDILPRSDKLDHGALVWMAGFWLAAASTPMWDDGPSSLRDSQLQSGITALELSSKV